MTEANFFNSKIKLYFFSWNKFYVCIKFILFMFHSKVQALSLQLHEITFDIFYISQKLRYSTTMKRILCIPKNIYLHFFHVEWNVSFSILFLNCIKRGNWFQFFYSTLSLHNIKNSESFSITCIYLTGCKQIIMLIVQP